MYRYGDGTPFPYDENFIDIVAAAVDACAAMFVAATDLDALRQKARDAKRDAEEETRRLAAMEKTMDAALFASKPSLAKDATISQQTAQRIATAVKQQCTSSRLALDKRAALAAAEPKPERAAAAAHAAAQAFFDHHQLPRTSWAWRWSVIDREARGDVTARSGKFTVTSDLSLDATWRAPLKIGALAPNVSARLPRRRLFGKPAPAQVQLDRCALISADREDDLCTLVIRANPSKPSPGWRIMLADLRVGGAPIAACTAIDAEGHVVGDAVELEGESVVDLVRLADAVSTAMDTMRSARRAREVLLGDNSLASLPDPTAGARAILDLLAPTIKNIRAKSRVPGELAIKRDLTEGHREELFVPRAAIVAKYARLPVDYRRYFDEAGLGRDDTSEIADEDIETSPATGPTHVLASGPGAATLMMPPPPRSAAA